MNLPSPRLASTPLLALLAAGCIPAPEIVVVDRATVLEEQAAGSFGDVEQKLTRSAIVPHPVPLTPAQLEALGVLPPPLVDHTGLTDADRVDGLLAQHCIGEARNGLLAETPKACRGAENRAAAATLVGRVNRARVQLWDWLHGRRPDVSTEELRRSWRRFHAEGVVCGGWIQRDDGVWEAKGC